ncbi:HAD family hydrolase [Pseudoclavibacter sp. RFBB5]|uniref:HAD family hydrolase n=1 Tax=Pseudoclavibacter sp. RFBB5 TaxID=2080574 RepID=UPI000CE756E7|nr:HAD-IA family hydrolase [Pseudoclavibacter sp. RFBB5]PPG32108.1 phosphoglycolate phosphatase [Pseudoclavibacter sp. RFBB5]
MTYTSVIFDLDGTLVDSSQDIANALNRVLAPYGANRLEAAQVVPLLGEGPAHLVSGAIRASGASVPDERKIADAYLADYRQRPLDDTALYEGVADVLAILAEAGIPLAVCTNKTELISRIVLDGLRVGQYFSTVVGSDRPVNSKPHAEHLLTAIAELGADPALSMLVGDSTIDQRCARNADVPFFAVPWAPPEVDGPRLRAFKDLPDIVLGTAAPSHTSTPEEQK